MHEGIRRCAHAALQVKIDREKLGPGRLACIPICIPAGEIDREKLGRLIFNSPTERRKLNAATHLPVGVELLRQVLWHWAKCTQVLYIDMPLLFETGAYKWMARNVVVVVDTDMQ
eukprot:scaffold117460_cov16-Tisochrysis_lutea.AAC.1